jgi:hypothetical protein
MLSEAQNLSFSAVKLSAVAMQTQFQPIAAMSALRPTVPSLLDSVSAISATSLAGADMIDNIQKQAERMHREWMEKARREAILSLVSPF